MDYALRSLAAAIVVVGLLCAGSASVGMSPRVGDEAKFFSPAAVEKANQKIRQIGRDYGKDVLIETVPRIPPDLQPKFKDLGKRQFFAFWSKRRAEEAGIQGIHVLICKTPGHLQIEVDNATRRRGFTLEDRDQLVKKMLPLLDKAEKKSNDAALLLAVDTIDSSLRAALGKAKPAASGAGQTGIVQGPEQPTPVAPAPVRPIRPAEPGISLGGWILIALAVFAGLWLLSALLRAISGARGGAGPGGAYGGAGGGFGGGGFFGSLMAGMFGAAAGSWLYDTFLRGGGSGHAFGAAPDAGMVPGNEPGAGDFSGDPGGGGDFGDDAGDTGGGGDFGDSGAGDFGGGDFGGGDFGGGDFGGGDFGS